MRVQNQLFSDWQNLILFTGKIFRWRFPAAGGGFRRAVAVPASGAVSGERRQWWSAVVNGGGSNGQWCKVVVVVNGERIRKIKSCSNEGCPTKKIIAAMKAVQKKNNCSNEGCQEKWLQQWRLSRKMITAMKAKKK